MFSGIIEKTGRVKKILKTPGGLRLFFSSPLPPMKKGDSIAVNGCCLTVVSREKNEFSADLSHETLNVTNLKLLCVGDTVNLERPIRLADRISGHLVQGHVDGLGKVLSICPKGTSYEIQIGFPAHLRRYLAPKGSIAVDGISMTLNRLNKSNFTLVVIPHTFQNTNFKNRQEGDSVNLEVDIIGKHIESLNRGR